jgi:adhesin transport system outer membrane protein
MPGVGMFGGSRPSDPAGMAGEMGRSAEAATARGDARSVVIDDLITRRSVLPATSPYAQVAEAVLTANKGPAAAELRVARLKAEAKSKNWLPRIGPSVDLTSLGKVVASLLVEQVLFDNGKRKAEREFAAADVELAAVSLSTEMNRRVHEGLVHFVTAQRATAQASVAQAAVGRLQDYRRIIALRVEGGVSDESDARVIRQKLAEMDATASADLESAQGAMAELSAMIGGAVPSLSKGTDLLLSEGTSEPLSVLRADGEARQLVAEARMQRADNLPGLSADATIAKGGVTGGLRARLGNALGFDTAAKLQALEATEDVAAQRKLSARDDAQRSLIGLQRDSQTLTSRQANGSSVLRQTEETLSLFTEQYKVGRRPLMELVSLFETTARLERDQAAIRYDIALLQLRIARERGVLVDGARM